MDDGIGFVPTVDVYRSLAVGPLRWVPTLSECPQSHQHVEEVLSLVGEPVLMANRLVLVRLGPHQAGLDERLETCGEGVSGDAEALDELVEATQPLEGVSQDEDCPGVTDDVDGVGYRAFQMGERGSGHVVRLASCELQRTIHGSKFRVATHSERKTMSKLVRRHRRENLSKATKPFTPVFTIDLDQVIADLVAGRS
jgi:hypothetical protein